MDNNTGFVNLLYSQSPFEIDSSEPVVESSSKERRKWSLKEEQILIGPWRNTSKDAVISNEQKSGVFWKRIVQYYNASPYLAGTVPRELGQCKQRWARINEQVCKFAGCYDATLRAQKSGINDDDVMTAALGFFDKDHGVKFSMEHAWRELRHDQKWCSTYVTKDGGSQKRKQVQAEVDRQADVGEPEEKPVGVKAAKGVTKKKKSAREEELSRLQSVLEVKERLVNNKLLERLLGKKEPLSEMETALKLKLMSQILTGQQ